MPRRVPTPTADDLIDLNRSITALAVRLRNDLHGLRSWETEDLVQEVYLKAILKLDRFEGGSSLKTWVVAVARNHLLSLARRAAIRPRPLPDPTRPIDDDPGRRLLLRSSTTDLLAWLSANPEEVDQGWQVLNLMLWSHGNWSYVATAMCLYTGEPWTVERVRNVIRAIRKTPRGRSLCEALGITPDEADEERT